MRNLFILPILFYFTSCGSAEDYFIKKTGPKIPSEDIDSRFNIVIEEFKADSVKYDKDISEFTHLKIMRFGDMPNSSTVGICVKYRYSNDKIAYTEIIIDPSYQYSLNSLSFKGLLYHELGHCILSLPHHNGGIMNPTIYSEYYYRNNWDNLVTDLFNINN